MCTCTAAFLAAGRFGFAPTVNKVATAGLDLKERDSPIKSNDPAGAPPSSLCIQGSSLYSVSISCFVRSHEVSRRACVVPAIRVGSHCTCYSDQEMTIALWSWVCACWC